MERRNKTVSFDWSINVSNLISIIVLIATLISYGQQMIVYLSNVNNKVNIMWMQFVKDHPTFDSEQFAK